MTGRRIFWRGWGFLALSAGSIAFSRPARPATVGISDAIAATPIAYAGKLSVLENPAGSFRVTDYRIADDEELGLFLGGNGSYSGNNTLSWDPTQLSHNVYSTSALNANLQPYLQFQGVTRSRDLSWSIPFSFQWSQSSSETNSDTLFPTNRQGFIPGNMAVNLMAKSSPSMQATWYRGIWQGGLETSLNLDESIVHDSYGDTSMYSATGLPTPQVGYRTVRDQVTEGVGGHLEARLGLGRAVEARWAWNAMELVRDLGRSGCLVKPVSREDMLALSQLLARVGQEMTWDFRDKQLADTRRICRFLLDGGYLRSNDLDAVMRVSDLYLYQSIPRRMGNYAVALAEADFGNSWQKVSMGTTNLATAISQVSGQCSLYDDNVAPGAGLEAGDFHPLSPSWQLDGTARLDYRPYQRLEAPLASVYGQDLLETLDLSLSFIPNTRLSATLSNQASFETRHVEMLGQGPTWTLLESYDDQTFQDGVTLSFSCQMAFYLVATLSGSLSYVNEQRFGPWTATFPQGPSLDAFVAQYLGQPFNNAWTSSANFSLTDRLF